MDRQQQLTGKSASPRDKDSPALTHAFRDDSPDESEAPASPGGPGGPGGPGQSYRPETPAFDDEGGNSSALRWSGGDILGAIGLSITVSALVAFAGSLVDALLPSNGSPLGELVAVILSAGLSAGIVRLTKLPAATTINLVGLVTLANVAVHVISDGGETDLLGLPPSFLEAAVLSGIPFGIAWLYVNRKHGCSLRDLGFVLPESGTAYLIAIAAWVVALVGVGIWGTLVTDIDTISPPDNTTPLIELAGGSLVVAWLLVGLWGPVVEEIFFRGFLLGGIHSRMGRWPALLLSSGVFALFHVEPGLYVPTFILGLAFGWVYLKTRSIWPTIFAHALHNTMVLIAVWQDFG